MYLPVHPPSSCLRYHKGYNLHTPRVANAMDVIAIVRVTVATVVDLGKPALSTACKTATVSSILASLLILSFHQ